MWCVGRFNLNVYEVKFMNKDSVWEMGECTDKSIIYLNLKGMNDSRYSHFHITKSDVEMLISDLQTLLDNNNDRLHLKLTKN